MRGMQKLALVTTELVVACMGPNEYELNHGLLKCRGKWVVGSQGNLRKLMWEVTQGQGLPLKELNNISFGLA